MTDETLRIIAEVVTALVGVVGTGLGVQWILARVRVRELEISSDQDIREAMAARIPTIATATSSIPLTWNNTAMSNAPIALGRMSAWGINWCGPRLTRAGWVTWNTKSLWTSVQRARRC